LFVNQACTVEWLAVKANHIAGRKPVIKKGAKYLNTASDEYLVCFTHRCIRNPLQIIAAIVMGVVKKAE
jgi:hypothetical protein